MTAALLGFVLGWIGSMPIGGPVSLFVAKRGAAGRYREAVLLAVGAALAEAGYCGAALGGYDLLLDRWPGARAAIAAVGALVMVGFGIHFVTARHFSAAELAAAGPPAADDPPAMAAARSPARGLALGFSMVLLNPSVMLVWLAVLAQLHALRLEPEDGAGRLLFASGVGLGIVGWFATLVALLRRGRSWIRPVAFDRILRAVGGGLCAAGLYAIYTLLIGTLAGAPGTAP